MTRKELKNTFPWLGEDDNTEGEEMHVNAGDVVDELSELYESLPNDDEPAPDLPPDPETDLFIGVMPGGISYCDRGVSVAGDYKKLAFLDYGTLVLSLFVKLDHDLIPGIVKHAESIISRKGELFEISSCGQTVRLGGELKG